MYEFPIELTFLLMIADVSCLVFDIYVILYNTAPTLLLALIKEE